jgi:hypothetical protein
MGEMRNAYIVLVATTEGKTSFGRPKHKWEVNIETDLKEIWCHGMDRFIWIRTGSRGGLL